MNCPECQGSIEHSAIFCQYCGHQVGVADNDTPQEPDIQPAMGSTIDLRRFREAAPAAAAASSGQSAAPASLPVPAAGPAPRHQHHRHSHHHRAHRHRHGPHPLLFIVGGIILLNIFFRGAGPGIFRAFVPLMFIAGGISVLGGHSGRRFIKQAFKFAVVAAVLMFGFVILFKLLKFAAFIFLIAGLVWLASKILG
ncbi:MAG TPA: zinc ribbon domain-containing protein [Herpetosiphonaceae bacterium]